MVKSEAELKKAPSYSKEFCAQYFGRTSSAKLASDLMKNSGSETYAAVRQAAQEHGLIDGVREHVWAPNVRAAAAAQASRTYSNDEIVARAAFSEEQCKQLLLKKANDPGQCLGDLAKDPALYAKFKVAAVSYGLLAPSAPGAPGSNGNNPKTPALHTQLRQANEDATADHIAISDSLADSLRLPRGTRVEQFRLSGLIELAGQIQDARAEAEKSAETEQAAKDKA